MSKMRGKWGNSSIVCIAIESDGYHVKNINNNEYEVVMPNGIMQVPMVPFYHCAWVHSKGKLVPVISELKKAIELQYGNLNKVRGMITCPSDALPVDIRMIENSFDVMEMTKCKFVNKTALLAINGALDYIAISSSERTIAVELYENGEVVESKFFAKFMEEIQESLEYTRDLLDNTGYKLYIFDSFEDFEPLTQVGRLIDEKEIMGMMAKAAKVLFNIPSDQSLNPNRPNKKNALASQNDPSRRANGQRGNGQRGKQLNNQAAGPRNRNGQGMSRRGQGNDNMDRQNGQGIPKRGQGNDNMDRQNNQGMQRRGQGNGLNADNMDRQNSQGMQRRGQGNDNMDRQNSQGMQRRGQGNGLNADNMDISSNALGMPGQGMPGQGMPGQGMQPRRGQGNVAGNVDRQNVQGMPSQGMQPRRGQGMPGQGMQGQGMQPRRGQGMNDQNNMQKLQFGDNSRPSNNNNLSVVEKNRPNTQLSVRNNWNDEDEYDINIQDDWDVEDSMEIDSNSVVQYNNNSNMNNSYNQRMHSSMSNNRNVYGSRQRYYEDDQDW